MRRLLDLRESDDRSRASRDYHVTRHEARQSPNQTQGWQSNEIRVTIEDHHY